MTDVDALTAFIRARIAEEEADAKAALGLGTWEVRHEFEIREVGAPPSWNPVARYAFGGYAAHIARQDPAATLARVAALRALVGWNAEWGTFTVLRHVAAIWRDHPDYQPEWTP